jgi:hypothetical protein
MPASARIAIQPPPSPKSSPGKSLALHPTSGPPEQPPAAVRVEPAALEGHLVEPTDPAPVPASDTAVTDEQANSAEQPAALEGHTFESLMAASRAPLMNAFQTWGMFGQAGVWPGPSLEQVKEGTQLYLDSARLIYSATKLARDPVVKQNETFHACRFLGLTVVASFMEHWGPHGIVGSEEELVECSRAYSFAVSRPALKAAGTTDYYLHGTTAAVLALRFGNTDAVTAW